MPLTLRAVSLNDQPITKPITAEFGPQGGSIGRADTNTLSLPDPERRISRRQADVVASGSGYVIKNVGSANPIIVRDQSLALGELAPLRGGDQVRIGGYLLEVKAEDTASDDRTALDPVAPAGLDPFAAADGGAGPWPGAFAGKPSSPQKAPAFPPSSPFADLGTPVDQPITQPITASFGAGGGSIGRADTNTLALPDPERRISRRQAEIVAAGNGFVNLRSFSMTIRCASAAISSKSRAPATARTIERRWMQRAPRPVRSHR